MAVFWEKHRKQLFWLIVIIAFFMIYAYNLLTPYMSDDYAYLFQVREASSLGDLIKQQYGEYLSNSGRIIGQFNVRLSLKLGKQVFNVINSFMFTALALLMYANIRRKKKHDIFVLLLIYTFLWRFAVSFGQTMLWICGSCNYLWGSVFILGFIAFFRHFLERADKIKHGALLAAGTFLFGVLAGWCNENTSGGGFLLVLMCALNFWHDRRKNGRKSIYPFMISGMLGMCAGMLGMVSAPGVRKRSATMSEGEYTGLVGLLSRTYKITVNMKELFWTVIVITVIVLVFLVLQRKLRSWRQIHSSDTVLFLAATAATSYALALAPTPADRAFFGAGIFLFIACIQGIVDITDSEQTVKAAKYALVSVLCVWLVFTYLDNLVNLARIYREENERIELIKADKADPEGDGIVVVPRLREAFKTPYSMAHESDMTDDKTYWINLFYETYYDVGNITAIPREEWDELYGE
ncbi:MAG: DUF6056 family protein [Clostridium sp.]|nr:DUF6056 family protein [Clostridium sp.]